MRISIWQQFSSNHSANFTAVGRFETPEKASEARQTIEQLLRAVYAEQEARRARGETFPEREDPPTTIEIQYSKNLGITWNRTTLDWAFQADWAVRQIDNWLVVDNVLDQTNNGITPVDSIIQALGGAPIFTEELTGKHVEVNIFASAPTVEIADSLFLELSAFFSSAKTSGGDVSLYESVPPWQPWSEKTQYEGLEFDESRLFWGILAQNKTQLELSHLYFVGLGYGLPGLLSYLRAKGCISIEYSFTVASGD